MDKRLKFEGGEIEISSDELNLMPESNQGAINGINKGLTGVGLDMIASGVFANIINGDKVVIQDGYIYLNGETLKVDAQEVADTEGTNLYQFEKVTTYPTEGERNFRNGTTQSVYEINRAVAVSVPAITGLAVDGDTLLDKLKSLIQVQSDWNQSDNQEPDYIKNKPALVQTLLKGECEFGNIDGAPTGSLTVSGDFSSATKTNDGNKSTVNFVFPTIGTSDYTVSVNWLNQGASSDVKGWVIQSQTATALSIRVQEQSGSSQDLNLRIHIFK